jgi:signal transduction histidine kinase
VQDNGHGTAGEQRERIFGPFQQVGRPQSSPQEGAGPGLAISRDLTRTLKGELIVESEPGRGSTFPLRLPGSANRQPLTASRQPPAAGSQQLIGQQTKEPRHLRRGS